MSETFANSFLTGLLDMNGNNDIPAVVVADNNDVINEEINEEPTVSAPANDGKLLLTVIKYDSTTAKLLPGGKLAPTPSQLATSALGVIRAHLSNEGYLEKADTNKPFCTKDGIEVTDNITFDHYIEENPKAGTKEDPEDPKENPEANTENRDRKLTRHNIYILTEERETKKLDPKIEAFVNKPVDLSNAAKPGFATASTGAPLTSSFTHSTWAAEAVGSIIHPANMTEKEWGIVMRNNNLLSGQFLEKGPVEKVIKVPGHGDITRPGIDVTNVERAYYSAFALKPRRLLDYDITFTITAKEEKQMHELKIEPPDHLFRIPRFHIKDASHVRVFETKGSLETTMAHSSFTETSIDAAIAGTAFGFSGAAKGGESRSTDEKSASSRFNDTSYMHVVYDFPRVELILNEETLELSSECQADIYNLRHRRTPDELRHFQKRYGIFFARSVHLGGKLVSIDESDSVAGSSMSEKTKMLKAAASASVSGHGFQAEVNYSNTENTGDKKTSTEKKMTHSMSWSAEGGETTLCNNPPKWCPTVASFYNWRVMKQADVINIYELIGKFPGYEDIPTLVQNILHINADPLNLVGFSLELPPDHAKHGHKRLHFGQPEEKHIAQSHMVPALTDPHSLLPHGKEFVSDVTLKPMTEKVRLYGTTFGIPMSEGQENIWLGKSTKDGEQGVIYPRFKHGVKYPVQYLVEEGKDNEKTTSLFTLQIGGDTSSNRFLYGEQDKAANVMVEFLGKKNTPVMDYSLVTLKFSYVFQGATIPHVSNFRFKDIDNMDKPELEKLKQKIIKSLSKEPQEPERPEFTSEEVGTFGPPNSIFAFAYRNYARMKSWEKTPEVERRKKIYDKKKADYASKMEIYIKEKKKHDQEVQERLKGLAEEADKNYSTLKKEWDEHQKVMNEFVPLQEMVFKINYCDETNKQKIVMQRKAAAAALAAAQKAKANKLAEESTGKKQEAKAAAIKEYHDERLRRRKACILRWIPLTTKNPGPDWVVLKPKLERIKGSLDTEKAKRLGDDIQKKEDALTMLAEYDLEMNSVDAVDAMRDSPFWKAATAKIEVPV
ncbi:uncharacterized protein L203_104555 [Cryptococcus depauperatus CBS 7841]|uniref:MACPF-like domain-containing protein n=1 Tax=Cryptococcus depauperatus CBS 7841 TaxID=1295531 RepID=A0AAJ8JVP9_9TREE